jgi:anti-sigma-K factor RskA
LNTDNFISSGILEGFVMGWADDAEKAEVEAMAIQFPEIRKEIEHIQSSLEDYASKYKKEPPAKLKETIWAKIKEASPPVIDIRQSHIDKNHLESNKGYQNYLVAASISLLFISAGLNVFLYSRYHDVKEEISALNAEKNSIANQFKIEQTHLNGALAELSIIKQPTVKVVPLKGLPIAPTALATIYWDTQSKDVFLDVKNLPVPSAEKQYQLWAIVDGKPVDAGVFTMNAEEGLRKMKRFETAQAFAITLEQKGGSLNPSMDAMYVMGQI